MNIRTDNLPFSNNIKNIDTLKAFIESNSGFDINKGYGDSQKTLLHIAVYYNYIDSVKYLVSKGASIDHPDRYNNTPLHIAARNGYTQIVEYFVELGADVNSVNVNEYMPLHSAAIHGYMDTIKYLLNHGADTKHVTQGNYTAAKLAEIWEYYDIAEYIESFELVPTKGVYA